MVPNPVGVEVVGSFAPAVVLASVTVFVSDFGPKPEKDVKRFITRDEPNPETGGFADFESAAVLSVGLEPKP